MNTADRSLRPKIPRAALIRFFLALVPAALALPGCPPVSFDYLDVSCSIPEGEAFFSGDHVRIDFSWEPVKEDAERQLKFYEKGAAAETALAWEGAVLLIRPEKPWQKGQSYSFSLEGSLRTEGGGTYTVRLSRAFTYGGAGASFELLSSSFTGDTLSLVFSKPPLITSFNEKFSLSPGTEYLAEFFPGSSTVKVRPRESWQLDVSYAWELKNMVSADGWLMRKEASGIFEGPRDTSLPQLLEVCPVSFNNPPALWHRGLPLDGNLLDWQGIGFIFSKPMDEASVKGGIAFYPGLQGYFEGAGEGRFIFIPEEPYRLGEEYRILLADTVKDLMGLSLFDPVQVFFTGAGRWLLVDSLSLDDSNTPLIPGGVIQDHYLGPVTPPAPFRLRGNIDFSAAIPPEKRKAALDAVSLSVLFPPSAHNPALIEARWRNGGSRLSLSWEDLSQSSAAVSNYYQLSITGGAKGPQNAAGEYLKEDIWFVFCTR
ncbi:MAG: Ig-like domain-containing protein [Treponema sp.]|nr:Ig-like domain-containing protein [Treponema sp.]